MSLTLAYDPTGPVKRHKRTGVMSGNSIKELGRGKGGGRRARMMPKNQMTAVTVPRKWPLYADKVAVKERLWS